MADFNPNAFHAAAWFIWRTVLWVKTKASDCRTLRDAEERTESIQESARRNMWAWIHDKERIPTYSWTWCEQACDVVADYEKRCAALGTDPDDGMLTYLVGMYDNISQSVYEEHYYQVYGESVPPCVEDDRESDITLQTQRVTCLSLMFSYETTQFLNESSNMVAEGVVHKGSLDARICIADVIDSQLKSNERLLKDLVQSYVDNRTPRPTLPQTKSRLNMMTVQREASVDVENQVQKKSKRRGRASSFFTKKKHHQRKGSNKDRAVVVHTKSSDVPKNPSPEPSVDPARPNARPAPPRLRRVSTNSSEVTDRFRSNNKTQTGNIVRQFMIEEFVRQCWDAFTSQRNPSEGVEAFLTSFKFPSTSLITSATMRAKLVLERIPDVYTKHNTITNVIRRASENIADVGVRAKEIQRVQRNGDAVEWDDDTMDLAVSLMIIADAIPMMLDTIRRYAAGYATSYKPIFNVGPRGEPDHGKIYMDFVTHLASIYNDIRNSLMIATPYYQ